MPINTLATVSNKGIKKSLRNNNINGIFPPLKIKDSSIYLFENKIIDHIDKVNISDLEWNDKELVLRILFSKMNGITKDVDVPYLQNDNSNEQFHNNSISKPNTSNSINDFKPVFVSEGNLDDY